jgi:nitrite reductase (NAD(P)H)
MPNDQKWRERRSSVAAWVTPLSSWSAHNLTRLTPVHSCEAAKAVYDMPSVPDVSILIRQGYPLNRQLDGPAGELVLRKIEGLGVKVHTRCEPSSIISREDAERGDVFCGFDTPKGGIESDMVIFAIGIKPRDDLARKSGIKVAPRGGIEVGDDLSTSAEGVFAIGECASWRGNVSGLTTTRGTWRAHGTLQFYGLIAPGVEMADILAFNLVH